MAIGSLDKAGRLAQLRTYARCQVRSGYRSADDIRADLYDAVLDEEKDGERAAALTDELLAEARGDLVEEAASWAEPTDVDRLLAALGELRDRGIVVLEAVDDHWAAADALERLAANGQRPTGIAYFTHSDVWHAVEHGMLELNVWHGDTANIAPGDALLDEVLLVLREHGIEASFDEGRIETSVAWQRRPVPASLAEAPRG